MKIGIMTFHWATNYGAVLQAYALQFYLERAGHEVEIIRYHPLQNIILQRIDWVRKKKLQNFKKERLMRNFRKKYLTMSVRKYPTHASLRKAGSLYDVYISGSDQVWNYSFIQYAEHGHETYSYYLDFVDSKKIRISYAASLGTNHANEKYSDQLEKHLKKFSAISVREKTAVMILEQMHCKSQTVCDPTLLLEPEDYRALIKEDSTRCEYTLSYMLHENQVEFKRIEQCIAADGETVCHITEQDSINEWLTKISHAQFVITNSFHGMVVSILFHVPFIAVGVEHSDMDERFLTLLSELDLENRYLRKYEEAQVRTLRSEQIDWQSVDCHRKQFSAQSKNWLMMALKGVRI